MLLMFCLQPKGPGCVGHVWQHPSNLLVLRSPVLTPQKRLYFILAHLDLPSFELAFAKEQCRKSSLRFSWFCLHAISFQYQASFYACWRKTVVWTASKCISPMWRKAFLRKKSKMMQFLDPKKAPIFEPTTLSSNQFFFLNGTRHQKIEFKNGIHKWCPKKCKNVGSKLLRESYCIDMQLQPWIVSLAVC